MSEVRKASLFFFFLFVDETLRLKEAFGGVLRSMMGLRIHIMRLLLKPRALSISTVLSLWKVVCMWVVAGEDRGGGCCWQIQLEWLVSFINSVNQHFLSLCYVLDTALGIGMAQIVDKVPF